MRDGATPRRTTTTPHTTWAPERVQVDHWRRKVRPHLLREMAGQTTGLPLSRPLVNALLDELHISDDFDALIGPTRHLPATHYPQLLAIALLLRHSWCPLDLSRTAKRLGLSPSVTAPNADRSLDTHITPATADTAVAAAHARRSQGRARAHR
jgi:hypothetical protein